MKNSIRCIKEAQLKLFNELLEVHDDAKALAYIKATIQTLERDINGPSENRVIDADARVITILSTLNMPIREVQFLGLLLANETLIAKDFMRTGHDRAKCYRTLQDLMDKNIIEKTHALVSEYMIPDKSKIFEDVILLKSNDVENYVDATKQITELQANH